MAIGCLGLLALGCALAALSGPWLLRLISPQGLTITLPGLPSGEPTSAPRPTSTWPSAPSPTPTRQPAPTLTRLPATPTTAPAPTAGAMTELFSCTSADAECGWESFSGTHGDVSAVGPELFLVARDSGLVETEIPGVSVQDFHLRFVAKLSSESGDAGYSVAFRCDPASSADFSYEFEVLAS